MEDSNCCPICTKPYNEYTRKQMTICLGQHFICALCAEVISKKDSNCPFCRKKISLSEIQPRKLFGSETSRSKAVQKAHTLKQQKKSNIRIRKPLLKISRTTNIAFQPQPKVQSDSNIGSYLKFEPSSQNKYRSKPRVQTTSQNQQHLPSVFSQYSHFQYSVPAVIHPFQQQESSSEYQYDQTPKYKVSGLSLCPQGHRQGRFYQNCYTCCSCNNCGQKRFGYWQCKQCNYSVCGACTMNIQRVHQADCSEVIWKSYKVCEICNCCDNYVQGGVNCKTCHISLCIECKTNGQ